MTQLDVTSAEQVSRPEPASSPGRSVVLKVLRSTVRTALFAVAGLAFVIGLWWLFAAMIDNPVRLPTPSAVLDAIPRDFNSIPAAEFISFQSGGIKQAIEYTAVSVLIGAGIGATLGFLVGAFLGTFRAARELLGPPMIALGLIPVVVLAPFLSIWFGTARIVQAGLVIVFAFVTVAAVVQNATMSVSGQYKDYAMSLGARKGLVFRSVVLPAIAPPTIAAVRVGLAAGWSFQAAGELLGGSKGVGKLIQTLQGMSATTDILATLILLGILAVIVDGIVVLVGGWITRWQD